MSNNKKIKWGILGTGWIAHLFCTALKEVDNAELYAIGSRSMESAQKFANEFNVTQAYGSYEEVVKDTSVDVIYIATPHNLHYENTLMCLNNNKNVLCEKPFGVNGKEVRGMIAKAEEKNLFLMEAMWSRFLPHIMKAKEIIDSGEIGKVKLLTSYFAFKSSHGVEHRQFNKDLCGGALLDIGIYPVFLSLYLLGQPDDFTAIAAIGETGVDNSISMTFQYGNEALAVMHSSFMANADTFAEVHGEKGKIVIPHMWFTPVNIRVIKSNGDERPEEFEFKSNGYNYEAEEVVKCLQEGKKQSDKMSWKDSLQLIDMLDAIRKESGIIYPKHDKN